MAQSVAAAAATAAVGAEAAGMRLRVPSGGVGPDERAAVGGPLSGLTDTLGGGEGPQRVMTTTAAAAE